MNDMTGFTNSGYNAVAAVDWAQENYDIANEELSVSADDYCTIFASDALHFGGGLPFKQGVIPGLLDSDDWYSGYFRDVAGLSGASDPYVAANANREFFEIHGTVTATSHNGNNPTYGSVKPGDIAYFTKDSDPNGKAFHAAVVTAVLPDGNILYTQKGSMLNGDLNTRSQHILEDSGNFTVTFIHPKKDW